MKTFWLVTTGVAFVDGLTKWLASWFSQNVVYNLGQSKFGIDHEWQITLTLLCASLLVYIVAYHRDIVPGLPITAGLIMGGALGNLVSVISGPPGVLDFIPIGYIVINVADIALWIGAVGLVYVVARAAFRVQP